MPIADRYDPWALHTYHRIKPQVVALYPPHLRERLPTRKQYYTKALARAVAGTIPAPISSHCGLLDPRTIANCADTAVRLQVRAVEAWLTGALTAGYALGAENR